MGISTHWGKNAPALLQQMGDKLIMSCTITRLFAANSPPLSEMDYSNVALTKIFDGKADAKLLWIQSQGWNDIQR